MVHGDTEHPIEVEMTVGGRARKFVIPFDGFPAVRLLRDDGSLVDLERGDVWWPKGASYTRIDVDADSELAGIKRLLEGFLLIDGGLIRQPGSVENYARLGLLTRRLNKRVLELVREKFEPEAEGLTYAPVGGGYHLMLQTAETAVRVDDLGDGARAALLAAMLALAHRLTVLPLEEPELHMHPAGLYTYLRFLLKLAREVGFQVIASTHSVELVQIARALSMELGVESSVLYLERAGF